MERIMKQKIVFLIFIFSLPFGESWRGAFAQDIHFSQFYYSPLTTNPAQTGFFNGKYRFAVNYRDQWNFVSYYKTFSASVDMHLMDIDNNILGAGIYFINDKATIGHGTSGAMASIAYHKDLSGGTNIVAFGLQGGLMRTGFDPNTLRFGDQIQNQSNGTDAPTGEVFSQTSTQYVDVNAGVLWNFIPSDKMNIYAGISLPHLARPSTVFMEIDKWNLSSRFILQGGAAISVNENLDVLPSLLYMKQGGSKEFFLGTAVRFNFAGEMGLRLGAWYRQVQSDALVLMAGFDWKNLKLGLSYDINMSSLSEVSKGKGGFEIALIYIITPPKKKAKGGITCPRF